MMDMRFFPSRHITFYVGRMFLLSFVTILIALVFILQMLEILSEADKILAVETNDDSDVWLYLSMRLPQLVSRFAPFTALLAILLTLVVFNQNSEVIVMRASGMSAHQVIAPLIGAAFLIAAAHFVLNEVIVVRSNNVMTEWKRSGYRVLPQQADIRYNIWISRGGDNIRIGSISQKHGATELADITIYDIEDGTLRRLIRAERGTYVSHTTSASVEEDKEEGDIAGDEETSEAWRLHNVWQFTVDSGEEKISATTIALHGLGPDHFTLAQVDGTALPFWSLWGVIGELEAIGGSTTKLRTTLWQKIAEPLSSVLMPFLGAMAAFGLARSGKVLLRSFLGALIGFLYFVVDSFALSMGQSGIYPPFLAAWGPLFLFFALGEVFIIRTEE